LVVAGALVALGTISGELALLLPPTAALAPAAWPGAPLVGARCVVS
jgi:hypothetical protein